MESYTIRQGDQYSIPFQIMLDNSVITESQIKTGSPETDGNIEIVIGKLRKTWKDGQIKFNSKTYTFDFPLTQKETLTFRPGMRLRSQIRVKLRTFDPAEDNFIYSYDGPNIFVVPSISKERI